LATTHIEYTQRGRVVIDQATVSKLGRVVTDDLRAHVKTMMAINVAKFLLDQGLIEFVETEDSKMHVFKAYLELA
jgi:hypothetical protein